MKYVLYALQDITYQWKECLPKCNHNFHYMCIRLWLEKCSRSIRPKYSCPMCRDIICLSEYKLEKTKSIASTDFIKKNYDLIKTIMIFIDRNIRDKNNNSLNNDTYMLSNIPLLYFTSSIEGNPIETPYVPIKYYACFYIGSKIIYIRIISVKQSMILPGIISVESEFDGITDLHKFIYI